MKKAVKVLIALLLFLTGINRSEGAIRLGVTKFQSASRNIEEGQLDLITDNFINTLAGSKSIEVLERSRLDVIAREQRMSLSGLVDTETAVKIGKLSGCRYIITGSVYVQGEANISVRVVDVSTGRIYFSMSETGKSPLTLASLLGNRVREEIAHEYAYVSDVKGRSININRGSKDGVHRGDLYRVYTEGSEIYDAEGNLLGRSIIDVAVVRVKDVRANFSTAEILKDGGRIEDVRRSNKVENISEEYAHELIADGIFSGKSSPEKVKQEDAEDLYAKGEKYYDGDGVKQNYKEALKYFRRAADLGYDRAQFMTGFMYDNGEGVKQNYTEAMKWYRKAAAQGHATAQNNIGAMYENGDGVKQNYEEAVKWYSTSAAQGYPLAIYNLGYMYENGRGVKKDINRAIELYREAAQDGNEGEEGYEEAKKALKELSIK